MENATPPFTKSFFLSFTYIFTGDEPILTALNDILHSYSKQFSALPGKSPTLKGKWFEIICRHFLQYDPLYHQLFSEVWLWHDWPGRNSRPDTGIDIVAQKRIDGTLCAVQCKFYEPGYSVSKADIDSFLSASGKTEFSERLFISAADNWNKNAEDTIRNQLIPCTRLTVEDMQKSPIDWSAFDINNPSKAVFLPQKTLRPDQLNAVNAVLEGLQNHDRGKLIMACGTGKTLTSLRIAEKFAGKGKTVLFLVPFIALLNQSLLA